MAWLRRPFVLVPLLTAAGLLALTLAAAVLARTQGRPQIEIWNYALYGLLAYGVANPLIGLFVGGLRYAVVSFVAGGLFLTALMVLIPVVHGEARDALGPAGMAFLFPLFPWTGLTLAALAARAVLKALR